MYAGDFTAGDTFDVKFTTRRFSTGAPFTLAGTPVISAYPDNSVTQLTAGITLTVDFDSVTGLNNVRVVATVGNGYAAGSSYALVITTGTVDSVSVVGEVIGSFTLGRSAAFARLGAPSGASVSADIAGVQSDTDNIQTRIPAALVGGRMDSSIGAAAAGVLAAASFAAGAFDAVWTVSTRTLTAFGASLVQEIFDRATSALTTAGSIGKLFVDNLNAAISSRSSHSAADVWASGTRTLTAATNITSTGGTTAPQTGDSFARLGAPAGASVSADLATVKADTTAIKTKTDALPASPAAIGDQMTLSASERDAIADAHLDRVNAIETGLTPRQAQRLQTAAAAGKLAGAATTTVTVRNAVADNKDRITATVDVDGNRTAVATDLT